MVAHLDAVTSLAVDVNGLYLISGSKYKSILEYVIIECEIFAYPEFWGRGLIS